MNRKNFDLKSNAITNNIVDINFKKTLNNN